MIEFVTLGALHLRRVGSGDIGGVLRQPKRLALLAYLSAGDEQVFRQRDELLAVFWPEAASARARNALNRALYHLRTQLGERSVLSRGSSEVAIDPAALWCDAAAFERHIAQARLVDALALYRGDFLSGFHLPQAADFERWLERERSRLRQLAVDAAWALADAEEKADNAEEAIRCCRWLLSLKPDCEPAVRRLMRLLTHTGDRTAAITEYETFARRLAGAYELEPSPETRGLAAALRATGAAVDGESRSAPDPIDGFTARTDAARAARSPRDFAGRLLAVMPFTYYGPPEFAYASEAVAELLALKLQGGELRVTEPRALLGLMRRDVRGLDLQRARLIAQRLRADVFINGSVINAGGHWHITATLHDTAAGERGCCEAAADTEAGIFEVVEQLALRLLIDVTDDATMGRLAAEATASLPALKAYLEGETELHAGRLQRAIDAYARAAATDERFTLAWLRLALTAAWAGDAPAARAAVERTAQRVALLPLPQRRLLGALVATLDGDYTRAEELYRDFVLSYPESVEGWIGLGLCLLTMNPLRGRSGAVARTPFERAAELDPHNARALVPLAYLDALEGRRSTFDERARLLGDRHDFALFMRLTTAFASPDATAQERLITQLDGAPDLVIHEAARYVAILSANLPAAIRIARLLTASHRTPEALVVGHVLLAHLEAARGRAEAAQLELDAADVACAGAATLYRALFALMPCSGADTPQLSAVRESLEVAGDVSPTCSFPPFSVLESVWPWWRDFLIGCLSARLGDGPRVQDKVAALRAAAAPPALSYLSPALAQTVLAVEAAAHGQHAAALSLLEQVRLRPPLEVMIVQMPFFSHHFERYLRATLLATAGRCAEAEAWFDSVAEASAYGLPWAVPALQARAGLLDRSGRREEAARCRARVARLVDGGAAGPAADGRAVLHR
jgi:DNA-binding SARP family transcriptional activator